MTTTPRISLEAIMRLPSFYFPTVSHDGRRVAYYSDETGHMELWLLDIDRGEARQISHGDIPRSIGVPAVWDRAGKTLVFTRDLGGNEQHDIWSLDVQTGASRQLTSTPQAQEIPVAFSPDDARLSFLSTRDGQLNLYKMRRDGSDVTQLTYFSNPVEWGGFWSPDGTQLIANSNETDDLHNVDAYLVPADGGVPRKVFSLRKGAQDIANAWSPDGNALAVSSDESGVTRAGVLSLDSGQVRWFGTAGVEEDALDISPDGEHLLALRNRDARLIPVVYQIENGAERLLSLPTDGSVAFGPDVGFALDGAALILKYSTDRTRPALLLYNLRSSETRTLIEPTYGSIDPTVFVAAEDISYSSFDGLRIHALLYRPPDIDTPSGSPALVVPHGGPTAQYWHIFSPLYQYLANQGYVILTPNIRGSTGYGVEFRDMARNDWGGADLQDIVAAREYLAALQFVDPHRIGIFGGSYGGFMTYIATTKAPDKWKAGAALVGVTDLPAMYEESMPHFKYFLREQMGDPKENLDLWQDRSAANFAGNLQAKLLMLHGVNDPRCPVSQARIFRDRLLEQGKTEGQDFEYVEFGEEGHGSTDQEQRIRMYGTMTEFLNLTL